MSLLDDVIARRFRRAPVQVDPSPVLRWAAVAAILAPEPDALLLVRRAQRTGDPWSGHMAMPGGRREEDEDLLFTAIRETDEEAGIVLPPESLVGMLDDVAPRTPVLPPIAVRPFVFRLDRRPAIRLSEELTEAHWITLDSLLAPGAMADTEIEVLGRRRLLAAYPLAEGTVWGMTERIVSDLLRA